MTSESISDANSTTSSDSTSGNKRRGWHFQPEPFVACAPYYEWPLRPGEMLKHFASSWSPATDRVLILGVATLTWLFFTPALERCKELTWDWVLEIWSRNLVLVLVVAGGLHLYLYHFKKQGMELKYNSRDLATDSSRFHFRNQVWDNMFWVLTSAVTFWSAYEVLLMWAFANGFAPLVNFDGNPVWFLLLLGLIPYWAGFHFYWVHRALHWPPLYKLAHSWHHKNINTGPWSGPAMHPLEHLFWVSDVLIYFVVASHPIHLIYNLQIHGLGSVTSHAGFDRVKIGGGIELKFGDFFHQLHHRYFDCNYGVVDMPWDKWFGSLHDGTAAGDALVRERRRQINS